LDEKGADEILVNEIKRRQADKALDRLMKDEEFKKTLINFLK
jgi:hypothetical protein